MAGKIVFRYCGQTVSLEFTNGNIMAHSGGRFVTENRFIQDTIENDDRYKKGLIHCVDAFDLSVSHKPSVPVQEMHQTTRHAAGPVNVAPKSIPETPDAPDNAGGLPDSEESSSSVKPVRKVKDVNGALSYFAKLGESPTCEDDIKMLMEKYRVSFPNWVEE